MRLHTQVFVVPALLMAASVLPLAAQEEPGAMPNLIKTAEAVVEWYARNSVMPYEPNATLVLSSATYNRRLAPNIRSRVLVEREEIPIPPGWIKMMSRRTGRSIETCDQ